ncbi:hypothetical protein ABBQ38_012683 [Trebouxia sp. C0009 RCD-2024]
MPSHAQSHSAFAHVKALVGVVVRASDSSDDTYLRLALITSPTKALHHWKCYVGREGQAGSLAKEDGSPAAQSQAAGGVVRAQDLAADLTRPSCVAVPSAAPAQDVKVLVSKDALPGESAPAGAPCPAPPSFPRPHPCPTPAVLPCPDARTLQVTDGVLSLEGSGVRVSSAAQPHP